MPDEPRQRIGRYEIVGPLDAGGMGQVYRAWDPSLRREVALKIMGLLAEWSESSNRN